MSDDDHTLSRRKFLGALGATAAGTMAGCDALDGGNNSDPETETYTDTPTTEPEPEYELTAEIPDEFDYTESEEAEIELYVERVLDGERETLDSSNVEITSAETLRNHPEYSDDVLQDAGLYEQVLENYTLEGDTVSLGSDQLIAGNNTLTLELEFQDEEHGESDTYTIEEDVTVQKTEEETREDTWINDIELWDTLREDYIETRLTETGWINVTETVEQETDFTKNTQGILEDIAIYWAINAQERVNGRASGQAEYLAQTVEYLSHNRDEMEEFHAFKFQNQTHSTAGAYNDEKLWNVESNGHEAVTPPSEGTVPHAEPEQTPLMNPEGNTANAVSTVGRMMELHSPERSRELGDDDESYLQIREEAAIELMDRMREDENGMYQDETWETLYNYGLSAALSPEAGIELSMNDL